MTDALPPQPLVREAQRPADPAQHPSPRRRWGIIAIVLGLLACLVLLTVALAGARSERRELADAVDRREEALAAARAFAVALTSYDYNRISEDVAAVTAGAADSETCRKGPDGKPVADAEGCFRSEYATAGGEAFQELVRDNKAVSKGTVRSAGVVSDTDGRVVVLLAVDQTVTNVNRPQSREDRNRIQLTLERIDGKWLVVHVEVL